MNEQDWEEQLKKTTSLTDFNEREEKIARISRDPKAVFAPDPVRDYPTTEKHYIVCFDELAANNSLPEASLKYGSPHKVGGFLISDRLEVPAGWIKAPPRGTSIDAIKDSCPALYAVLSEKKVATF